MRRHLSIAILLFSALQAMAWGQKGHDTTAAIAERHFTQRTAAAVDSLLAGYSPVYWSNWLDNASHTDEYAYTKTWHYKNVDPEFTFDSMPAAYGGDIVQALEEQARLLKGGMLDAKQSALALKIIIHLVGDMHQPMHMGWKKDRGGNQRKVNFFERETNLHSVWDSSLPEAAHKWSYTEWCDQIDRLPSSTITLIQDGTIADWARETQSITSDVYAATPEGTIISYDYIAFWTPVVEYQFLKGGLRLAALLNSIFDPEADGSTARP